MMYTLGQINLNSDIFNTLPGYVKIIMIVTAILMGLGVVVKYGIDIWEKIKPANKKKELDLAQLKNHSFFSKCESWSKYKVTELYFGDDVRNRLFRTIVSIKIDVMSTKAMDMLESHDLNELNKKCFQTSVFKLLTDMYVDTQDKIRGKMIEMYPKSGNDIYELVMNHEEKGFNAFNQITDNYTERLVQIICESDMYSDNYEKYEMILDAFKAALGAAFPHIESAFKGFNGELDNLVKKK